MSLLNLCGLVAHHLLSLCLSRAFDIAGICRRIAMATMSLLNQCGSVSTVEQINNMFHVISIRWPTLMVQWSNVLILLNYGNKACWSDLLQTAQTFSDSISRFFAAFYFS